ncbi:MAG TPA: hypothetical protein VMJ32_12980 [Pirellulales bacterium]|nr:hypothetical protein [Pirellulales bacterium]
MPSILRKQSDFPDAIRLQLALYGLFKAGQQNSANADEIRGEMEHYWWRLTESEQSLLEGLAADLRTVGIEWSKPRTEPTQEILHQFKDAIEASDWDTVLELTREHEHLLQPSQVAEIRGVSWMHLGFPQVALLFFEDRIRFGPRKALDEVWFMTSQIASGKAHDAVPRALEIARMNSDPLLMMSAAHVLSFAADAVTQQDSERFRRQAIEVANLSLKMLSDLKFEGLDASSRYLLENERMATLLRLAYDLAQVGELSESRGICETILGIDPTQKNARILLAWLLRDENQQRAQEMFFTGFTGWLSSIEVDRMLPFSYRSRLDWSSVISNREGMDLFT